MLRGLVDMLQREVKEVYSRIRDGFVVSAGGVLAAKAENVLHGLS
jgi:hypothetical protein